MKQTTVERLADKYRLLQAEVLLRWHAGESQKSDIEILSAMGLKPTIKKVRRALDGRYFTERIEPEEISGQGV
jgi:hypothetical protein